MAFLKIKDIEITAKGSFFFAMKADKKYKKVELDDKGKEIETPGIETIYLELMQRNTMALVKFWDCACANYPQMQFNEEDIQQALTERIDEDQDTIYLLNDAIRVLEESGFFKQQTKTFWKNFQTMTTKGTEEEKKQRQEYYEMMMELNQSIKDEAQK